MKLFFYFINIFSTMIRNTSIKTTHGPSDLIQLDTARINTPKHQTKSNTIDKIKITVQWGFHK